MKGLTIIYRRTIIAIIVQLGNSPYVFIDLSAWFITQFMLYMVAIILIHDQIRYLPVLPKYGSE